MSSTRYKFLQLNTSIEVTKEDDEWHYKSLIQDVKNDSFLIGEPVYKNFTLSLKTGQKIGLGVFTKENRITFDSSVIKIEEENGLKLYTLSLPQNVQKHERRDFVRVEVAINVKYEIVDFAPSNLNKYKPSIDALAVDISGGGMMLSLKKSIPQGSFLVLEFDIECKDKLQSLKVLGQVKRIFIENIRGMTRYLIGVSFHEIDERTRDEIIHYVFDKMIKNIRKNLG